VHSAYKAAAAELAIPRNDSEGQKSDLWTRNCQAAEHEPEAMSMIKMQAAFFLRLL
jgi:hypothetical protein